MRTGGAVAISKFFVEFEKILHFQILTEFCSQVSSLAINQNFQVACAVAKENTITIEYLHKY